MEIAALGALAKPALYLAILVGVVWVLARIKRAGRVEAERDATRAALDAAEAMLKAGADRPRDRKELAEQIREGL
jgi:hypothetical protein